MQQFPLAYHITFGTYGTRLHGDPRGTVSRAMNVYGDPIIGSDPALWEAERESLRFEPVVLDVEKMQFAEAAVPEICVRGKWNLHTCAGGPDHFHTVLSARVDGEAIRKWFKRWLGEALSARWPLPLGATWWAEAGSVKWVWTPDYLERVVRYVHDQRATRI